MLTMRAGVLGVPELELAVGGVEVGAELVVELGDIGALLEDLVVESAVGIADVPVSLVALERGAALVTGHVARPEHVCERSAAAGDP